MKAIVIRGVVGASAVAMIGIALACGSDGPLPPRTSSAQRVLSTPVAVKPVPAAPKAAVKSVASRVSHYSPIELHRRNPADWAGRAHNAGLNFMFAQMRNHVRFHDACLRMLEWLSDPHNTGGPPQAAGLLHAAPSENQCKPRLAGRQSDDVMHQTSFNVMNQTSLTVARRPIASARFKDIVMSDSAYVLLSELQTAANSVTDPTSFASALGPLLDAASTLADDSIVVQAAISVAESSEEYWYADSYANIASAYSAVATDLNEGCSMGEYQGQSYTEDGATMYCDNGRWVESSPALNRPSSTGVVRFASYAPGAVANSRVRRGPICEAAGNNAIANTVVVAGDVGGGIIGGIFGIPGGPIGIIAGAFVTGAESSGGVATGFLIIRFACAFMM